MKKKIAILGSTGSIGKTLIELIDKNISHFEIKLLVVNNNIEILLPQIKRFKVKNIIVTNHQKFIKIKKILKNKKINVYNNFDNLDKIFKNKKVDYSMSAISGLQGLDPTLKIIKFSKKIAIANKESIICAWPLIKKELNKYKTTFVPIDSEHFSIWELINNSKTKDIDKIFITASGGPFLNMSFTKTKTITVAQALNHPNWKMGKKISIDSATMMNKVFEIIEAKKIFDIDYNKLHILIHPKSYVHAIVKFNNGLTKILIHDTDMKIPIFNSLYPNFQKYITSQELNINILNNLNFKKIDNKIFPAVKVLNTMPSENSLFETILVSANDSLVKLFLEKKITFQDISIILLKVLKLKEFQNYKKKIPKNVDEIVSLSNYVSLKITTMSI
jgi:1-deoxy-D-xylulose-5-phosphate reductoisomerase